MSSIVSEVEQLKIIYKSIIDGCSFDEITGYWVKHLNDLENSDISGKKLFFFERYRKRGLPSEEEKLKQLIDSEQWDSSKEEEIINLQYLISDNEQNVKKLIPQQQGPILKIIEETKEKLSLINREKRQILGRTANEFAERDAFNYFIFDSLYKDKGCTQKIIERFEDFDDLPDEDIIAHAECVERKLRDVSEKNVNKIAVLPFFLNTFSFAKEHPHFFVKRCISELTPYHTLLFSLGTRNLNILSQSEGSPPPLIGETKIEEVILWFDKNFSIILGKQNSAK